jgi:hypothetical protein
MVHKLMVSILERLVGDHEFSKTTERATGTTKKPPGIEGIILTSEIALLQTTFSISCCAETEKLIPNQFS